MWVGGQCGFFTSEPLYSFLIGSEIDDSGSQYKLWNVLSVLHDERVVHQEHNGKFGTHRITWWLFTNSLNWKFRSVVTCLTKDI